MTYKLIIMYRNRRLFGGALAKVEGRARLQPSWALLLTDLLVFARVSRDRVLFVTEEPLRLADIAEACFTIRKRPTEFRLQVAVSPGGLSGENGNVENTNSGGCSPHGRPRRRVLILRAPSPELKAVWHNLLQRQMWVFVLYRKLCEPTKLIWWNVCALPVRAFSTLTFHQNIALSQCSRDDFNIINKTQQIFEKLIPSPTRGSGKEKLIFLLCWFSINLILLYFRIYVNTGCGGTPDIASPIDSPTTVSNFTTARESIGSRQVGGLTKYAAIDIKFCWL